MAENRRTRRTKRALKEAIVSLVLERGYESVTIEDITEEADISRATFYAYFKDKQALLTQIVLDLQEGLRERLADLRLRERSYFSGDAVRILFEHAAEERDAYRVILRGEGNGIALRRFVDERTASSRAIFEKRAELTGAQFRLDPEILTRAWVGEQVTVLQWWLEPEVPPMSAAEVARILTDLSIHGRMWASGFDAVPEVPKGELGQPLSAEPASPGP
ncbi:MULTISPECIES: TetR/AcrR family transcriptional regulator [Brevibacterium]|jgi:AcrR family transcriptional regulator|uniref:TetR/AcrR family transcriptional regulator n=1 Tax=Brevibacterium salitolerans TaxID=1403566 RepID=A0ABP5IPK1_9MICO|nr:TetR/AcrR family transcriptional regulator [Brevibacterium sp.]